VIVISKNEKDYSDYLQATQSTLNVLVLLSGFTFTGITILLSQFPVLDSLRGQFILFFLASLLFLFMFLMSWAIGRNLRYCRSMPPVTRDIASFNRLTLLSYFLLQFAVVLMFLLWNLTILSLASGVVLAMFVILTIRGYIGQAGRLHSNEGEDKA